MESLILADVEGNYLDEVSSRALYLTLADLDDIPARVTLWRSLADFEERHAASWERLLRETGHPAPRARGLLEHRLLAGLARMFGVGAVLPILHRSEVEGIAKYRRQAARWTDPAAQAVIREILPDEIGHEVETFHAMRQTRASGAALRSAILGASDGLGSILALVSGVVAATGSSPAVVISGVAGVVAGAVSMAVSNYVSVKAEHDAQGSEARLLRDAAEAIPEAKRIQLEQHYQSRGLTEAEARTGVARAARTPEGLVSLVLTEIHGVSDATSQSAGRLAWYTGAAFVAAGVIPVIPFLLLPARAGIVMAIGVAGLALFLTGIVRALLTQTPFFRSGMEMLGAGLGSAAVTYLVGLALGVAVG